MLFFSCANIFQFDYVLFPKQWLHLGVLTSFGRVVARSPGLAVAVCWAGDASRCSFWNFIVGLSAWRKFFTVFVEPISFDTLLRRNLFDTLLRRKYSDADLHRKCTCFFLMNNHFHGFCRADFVWHTFDSHPGILHIIIFIEVFGFFHTSTYTSTPGDGRKANLRVS